MDKEFKEERENHVGRMIHMLSHQLKRRGAVPEMETGLTPMQKHILTFILFETMERDLYQRDIEEEFRIRRSTASGILKLMEKNVSSTAKALQETPDSNRLSRLRRPRSSGWIF